MNSLFATTAIYLWCTVMMLCNPFPMQNSPKSLKLEYNIDSISFFLQSTILVFSPLCCLLLLYVIYKEMLNYLNDLHMNEVHFLSITFFYAYQYWTAGTIERFTDHKPCLFSTCQCANTTQFIDSGMKLQQ